MKARISEIFSSLQGEGKYTGARQVFVRFFGCDIHCAWCDTPHSIGDTTRHFQEYTPETLLAAVDDLWDGCHSVSLTGGEPLVQADFLQGFLPRLKAQGKTTYLETSGTLPDRLQGVIEHVDIVAMDLKLPSSTRLRPFWDEHAAFLNVAGGKDTFVKAVISSATSREDIAAAVKLVARVRPQTLFVLQPNYFERNNGAMHKCLEYQAYCRNYLPNVEIMRQMHKEWKVR